MSAGRRLWAGLQLLDRQLVDRNGRMAGCVDDLELASAEEGGHPYVTAILTGPGALAYRLRRKSYGAWMRRVTGFVSAPEGDPDRVPFNRVTDIGAHVTLAVDRADLGSAAGDRWVRDHIVAHIPGSGHAPE